MVQNPGKEMFLLQKLAERGVRRLIPPGLKKKRENRIIMVIEAVGGGNMKLMRFIRILKKYSLYQYFAFTFVLICLPLFSIMLFPAVILAGVPYIFLFDFLGIPLNGDVLLFLSVATISVPGYFIFFNKIFIENSF